MDTRLAIRSKFSTIFGCLKLLKRVIVAFTMNNISTNFIPEANTTVAGSKTQVDSRSPLLPRSAWNSQLTYLKAVFKAKKALDRIEKENESSF